MPLNHYANGPLSATGVVESVQLDEMEIDQPKSQSNELTVNLENIQLNKEKIDTSHFALLKVLGQGSCKLLVQLECNLTVHVIFYSRFIWKSFSRPKIER